MRRQHVLHITNWYRSESDPFRALFIKEHFEALCKYVDGDLVHVEVAYSPNHLCKLVRTKLSSKEQSLVILSRLKSWFVLEIISTVLVAWVALSKRHVNFDVVTFHIGYPNLTYHRLVRLLFATPIVIIEHWTAFHFNFNLAQTGKLKRIKSIYRQGFPLITVSKSLLKDIEKFAGVEIRQPLILPNVVDRDIFYLDENVKPREGVFFMVNLWRAIKDPMQVIVAFDEYVKSYNPKAMLRIGGYGPLWDEIKSYVELKNLAENVILLGPLQKSEIANEMRMASAFLHCAKYETFSVVCAEAISCGCPVLVNDLDAVREFIDESNGIIVHDKTHWLKAFISFDGSVFNRRRIEEKAHAMFDKDRIGRLFLSHIEYALKRQQNESGKNI